MPERTANQAAAKRPVTAEMRTEDIARAAAEHRERVAEHDPEPVAPSLRHPEPRDTVVRESEMPAAVQEFYASRTTEEPAMVGGPSFLGLSGGGGGSSYSYLYEEEQPRSHAGTLVFLVLVLVLAGIVYWQWQPIRDYVVNAALTHSGQGRPAEAAAPTAPAPSTASSDNAQTQPAQPANPEGMPQQDSATTTDQPKDETAQPKDEVAPATKEPTSRPKDEQPRSEVGQPSRFPDAKTRGESVDGESVAKENSEPKPGGAELVNSGEKYLYGRRVQRNCSQAVVNFNAAAKQANPRAMSHLGSLYATGQCVAMDRTRAYQWYSRALALDRGNTYLTHNLNMLWREMTPQERARATQSKAF